MHQRFVECRRDLGRQTGQAVVSKFLAAIPYAATVAAAAALDCMARQDLLA